MKIMQVNYTMNIGGIEKFLLDISKNIDLKKYQFTFLTYSSSKYDYEEELKKLGCKICRIDNYRKMNSLKKIKELIKIINQEKPDVIHCHTYFDSAFVMLAAKICKVKIRITHSHTALALSEKRITKKVKYFISRIIFKYTCTNKLACSYEAGKALFGNNDFEIVTNGIDLSIYNYNEDIRKKYQKEFNINNNQIVIGHIGRIDIPKNHKFLLNIFYEIIKNNKNYKLICVGSGKLEKKVKKQAKELGIEKDIMFLGNRMDVDSLLNVFDIIVFPSIYEGLPISLVEAQANGLPIIVSDKVSKDIKLSETIDFYSLDKSEKEWADKIIKHSKKRIDTKEDLLKTNYSIKNTIEKLVSIYES